jgi:hypothetical protein
VQKPLFENFFARVQESKRAEEVNLIEQWHKEISLFLSYGEEAVRQRKIELEIACSQECSLRLNFLYHKDPIIYELARKILGAHTRLQHYLDYAQKHHPVIHIGMAANQEILSYEIYIAGWNKELQKQDFNDIPLNASTVRMLGIDTEGECSVYTHRLPPSPNFFMFTQSTFETAANSKRPWNYYKHLKRDQEGLWPVRKEGLEVFSVKVTDKFKTALSGLQINYFEYFIAPDGVLPALNFGYRPGCASLYLPLSENA